MKRILLSLSYLTACICFTVNVHGQVIFESSFTTDEGFADGAIGFGFPPADPNPDSIIGQAPWMVDTTGTGSLVNTSGAAFVRAVFGLTFGHTPEFPDPFTQALVTGLAEGDAVEIEATGMVWPGAGPNMGILGLANISELNILGGTNMASGVQFTSDGTNVFLDTNTDFTPNTEIDTGVLLGAGFDYLQRHVSKGAGVFDIEHHVNGSLVATTVDVTPNFDPEFMSEDTGGFIQDFGAAGMHSVDALRLEVIVMSTGPEGDFDGDLDIDGADFLKWQQDGLTPADLQAWLTNYGTGAPTIGSLAAVPEPNTAMLSLIGVVLCGILKRKS